ncbi:hypothetical protein ACYU03_13745 [Pseudomonas sp. X10]
MKWPNIDQVRNFTPLPEHYVWDFLRADEIDVAIAFFETWFPSISVGLGSPSLGGMRKFSMMTGRFRRNRGADEERIG